MSFLKRLFGRGDSAAPAAPTPSPAPSPDEQATIQVFDRFGRAMQMTRADWRDQVLLGNVEKSWDDPDALAALIMQAMGDAFFAEMIGPAERLAAIDSNPERAAVLLAIVYLNVGRIDDADHVLRRHIGAHGESAIALLNLAKVQAARGDEAKAAASLWRSLELDPNHENAVGWYHAMALEARDEAAATRALERVAALPGSWRAQFWLARTRLQAGQLDDAMALYRQSLDRAGTPAPADLLQGISGDLGGAGYLAEILALTEPVFDVAIHGLPVGNNLIKAKLELGRLDEAHRLVEQLYALQRPDWNETLNYWEAQIAGARVARAGPIDAARMKVALLTIEGPLWLRPESPANTLYPPKAPASALVTFLGSTVGRTASVTEMTPMLADASGRLSRSLPQFFAEQVHFHSGARVQSLVPWILEPSAGFVVAGAEWSAEQALDHVQRQEAPSAFVVVSHLHQQDETWQAQVRVLRTADSECVCRRSEELDLHDPTRALQALAAWLLACMTPHVERCAAPAAYLPPDGAALPRYLLRLEQLLAVRCGALDGTQGNFLSGEREILSGNIQLCLDNPDSVSTRILCAETALTMTAVRPGLLAQFRDQLTLLQDDYPLPDNAQAVVSAMMAEALHDGKS